MDALKLLIEHTDTREYPAQKKTFKVQTPVMGIDRQGVPEKNMLISVGGPSMYFLGIGAHFRPVEPHGSIGLF